MGMAAKAKMLKKNGLADNLEKRGNFPPHFFDYLTKNFPLIIKFNVPNNSNPMQIAANQNIIKPKTPIDCPCVAICKCKPTPAMEAKPKENAQNGMEKPFMAIQGNKRSSNKSCSKP